MKMNKETPIVPIVGYYPDPDEYGRDIKVGVAQGWYTNYLPALNFEEVVHLHNALGKLIEDHQLVKNKN